MKDHAIPPDELRQRIEAVAPEGELVARWFAAQTGRTESWAYHQMAGQTRLTETTVKMVEMLEEIHRLRGLVAGGVFAHQTTIERRVETLRDDLRGIRRDVRDAVSGALRRTEELEDTLTRALGGA